MENITVKEMDLTVLSDFKKVFPNLEIKIPRWAALGVTVEFRKMDIGDIVLFPVADYNYQTIRSTPSTTMVPEIIEGRKWKTKIDYANKSVAVLRIS